MEEGYTRYANSEVIEMSSNCPSVTEMGFNCKTGYLWWTPAWFTILSMISWDFQRFQCAFLLVLQLSKWLESFSCDPCDSLCLSARDKGPEGVCHSDDDQQTSTAWDICLSCCNDAFTCIQHVISHF